MDGVTIRKATIDDLKVLLQFELGVIEAERPFDFTLKVDARYYELEEMISASHIELLVAEIKNEIIGSGYARIEKSKPYNKHEVHAYLGFMYVHPEYRGKGINKIIIDELKEWARFQHVTELRLDVYFENLPAIKAYEKIGFTKHMIAMRLGLE